MGRLIEQFGKTAYSIERTKLIFQEVQDLDAEWFHRLVDRFIGECRVAPIMTEFRTEIAREKERKYLRSKDQNSREAKEFMSGMRLGDDERSVIVRTIIERAKGRVPDEDWECFMDQAANL